MTDRTSSLLNLAIKEIEQVKSYYGDDVDEYFAIVGALEACKVAIEGLSGQISETIFDTIEDLIDPKKQYSAAMLIAGADRVLGMLKIQEKVLGLAINEGADARLVPLFELNPNDRSRIEHLCEQMRKVVFSTADFDEPHRLRLLNRIAAIEAEIHKPQGMFDVVRGGINDLGETLGKFGKDVKPLTDRMREVVSIARKATREYDQLPEPDEVKQLPAPEEKDDAE